MKTKEVEIHTDISSNCEHKNKSFLTKATVLKENLKDSFT